MSDLKIENLSKSYRTSSSADAVSALDDVSLNVGGGEFLAIQGASGSGKSTLLYTIAGLVTPDAGGISFDSQDLTKMSASCRTQHRAQTIGLVFQDFRLVPYLNVLENITVVSGDNARAENLLDRMQLSHRMAHKPSQLSAGEQQRCAIARALINEPGLLLADEPTGNLDSENATIILDYLADYAATGKIVVMATHDPAAVSAAHRNVGMADGKLVS